MSNNFEFSARRNMPVLPLRGLSVFPGMLLNFDVERPMSAAALNFALNLLGCYVHDLRLQCLEYFGKFYEDGGKPFRPLDLNTKYYNVVK